jgi:hypothetical protein
VKFLANHNTGNKEVNKQLYADCIRLTKKLEYHILANHLLENGFGLLFGAYYFQDVKLYQIAKKIIQKELKEQILKDGAHYELSPMYHQIILYRVLDGYNLVYSNEAFFNDLKTKQLLYNTVKKMLSWNSNMIFSNGNIPLMNDAAFHIAPVYKDLSDYAVKTGIIERRNMPLKESGYRKMVVENKEIILNIGNIIPCYQPGHAHADTFNFELYLNGRPLIVDTGTSTYEVNERRFYERSTAAHNTVVVNNENSSQVWRGHRVAKRATVLLLEDSQDLVYASHNGYKSQKVIHKRKFVKKNHQIIIQDELDGFPKEAKACLHFAPDELFEIENNTIRGKDYTISINGAETIEILTTHYSPEFNKNIERKTVSIRFSSYLETIVD